MEAVAEAVVRNLRKQKTGTVVSNKMDKTIAVKVERRLMHPLYGKFVKRSKKFFAHDEENTCKVGDLVRIMETRPLSKNKRWRLGCRRKIQSTPQSSRSARRVRRWSQRVPERACRIRVETHSYSAAVLEITFHARDRVELARVQVRIWNLD